MQNFNREFDNVDDLQYATITSLYRQDETLCVNHLLPCALLPHSLQNAIQIRAAMLIKEIRKQNLSHHLDAFISQYDLSTEEGITLMSLIEALMRVPDKATQDKLIQDKLTEIHWQTHFRKKSSLLVNATTWILMQTGKWLKTAASPKPWQLYTDKVKKRFIRQAIFRVMKILSQQFVMASTIDEAILRAKKKEQKGYRYSYDMLGESALTAKDAARYFHAYQAAIQAIARENTGTSVISSPGISVKLSALHPRFVMAKRQRLHEELYPTLKSLVLLAREANISLTVDAEEAHTLMITLELIEKIIENDLGNWEGFGLAIQAYQKRAPALIDYLVGILRKNKKRMMIRLVKGAYWDTEIKLAQVQGLSGFPVFTRKIATDVSYIVCVKKILAATDVIYPQFATHNALTVATVIELAQHHHVIDYEFQCLHGMGGALYNEIVSDKTRKIPCRIYAPVGASDALLSYLMRRLLENGANTSFVNQVINEENTIEKIMVDPIQALEQMKIKAHPKIRLPKALYSERANSMGIDLSHLPEVALLLKEIAAFSETKMNAKPTALETEEGETIECFSPANGQHYLGKAILATKEIIEASLSRGYQAFFTWQMDVNERVHCLEMTATLLQKHRAQLISLLILEGGKTVDDAIAEVREAIDYCYYYSEQAKKYLQTALELEGPTGEKNQLRLHPRGLVICISPWNFPLAILIGQITAALAAGNTVIAKPATATILIAARAIELLHEAGFPRDVVQLLPVKGEAMGKRFFQDARISAVILTGSTKTACEINQQLAARQGPIIPLIAETGGQNAMIVDSTALPEQVTQDVLASAFKSAGQRCSALRVLFLQEEVAEKILAMIQGAMAELKVGEPAAFSTDIGPVIHMTAKKQLEAHLLEIKEKASICYAIPLVEENKGSYFAPHLCEIPSLDFLKEEIFGPILHVIRYKSTELDEVIAQINRTGYGLTLGIHSRIRSTIAHIQKNVRVGNVYVNRNMIGAVVGVQPFGGEGLSGTGPKAGGPFYLPRLCVEKTISENTMASGGNLKLMCLSTD